MSRAERALRRHRVPRQIEAAETKLRRMLRELEQLRAERLFFEEYAFHRRKYLPRAIDTLTARIARLRAEAAALGLQERAA